MQDLIDNYMKYIDFSLCLDYFICNGNNLHLQSQFLFYH